MCEEADGGSLWQLGQRIKEVYLKTMGERDAGILATMVVGDREFLDAETKRLYQIGGLSHILAISGLHISVIGMALYRMLKKAGLPFGMAALVAAGVMYGYGGMAGWGRFRETRGSHVPAVSGSTSHREEL